ncbi:MAG: hypothetical protein QXE81_05755 [Desulfurococcaceae archaeon]
METIGVYKDVPLVIDPVTALIFGIIGWIVVLAIVIFVIYRSYKRPAEAAKKP